MFQRLIKKAKKIAQRRLLITHGGDYRDTVFLAGTGRSGTTWIANIINYRNNYRFMFEPFYPQKVDIVSHFRYKQYLRPHDHRIEFIEPARTILSGKVKNDWINKYNRRSIAKKRLIKDIRANHLLKWIKTNFPEIPIVLLLRHPCAVAYSRLKLGWDAHLEEFLAQDELMQDFLNPFTNEMQRIQNSFEKYILMWCIENYVPLKQFKTAEIHLAFYENFCVSPDTEIDRLFTFLGETYTSEVFKTIRKPSGVSRKDSAIYSGENLIESWKRHITDKQAKRAVEILSLFGLQRIYSVDSKPLVSGDQNLLYG